MWRSFSLIKISDKCYQINRPQLGGSSAQEVINEYYHLDHAVKIIDNMSDVSFLCPAHQKSIKCPYIILLLSNANMLRLIMEVFE